MSVNKAIIVGRLGADPELRFTPSGRAVANFNLATSSVWKDKSSGERKEDTQWHKIVVWGPQAETCGKYLQKGREVFVEGEIRTRNYDDNYKSAARSLARACLSRGRSLTCRVHGCPLNNPLLGNY